MKNDPNRNFEVNEQRGNLKANDYNPNLEKTNIVSLDDSRPIDLNLMSFINNMKDIPPEKIDTSQDLSILEKVSKEHDTFKKILSKRFENLQKLKGYWTISINSAISCLKM